MGVGQSNYSERDFEEKPLEEEEIEKLLEELHNVRLRSEGKLVEGDEQEATSTTTATPTVRRRTRRVV